jgi:hypothetical protein
MATTVTAHAAARAALIERLAQGHWKLDWPHAGYPWAQENQPTADAIRRGARRCLDAIALAGLRLIPDQSSDEDGLFLDDIDAAVQALDDRGYPQLAQAVRRLVAQNERLTELLDELGRHRDNAIQYVPLGPPP